MVDTLSVLSKGTVSTTPFVKTYAIHFALNDPPQSIGMSGMWAPDLGGYRQAGARNN